MSASDVIKKALVEYFSQQGVKTKISQWKRRSKVTVQEDYTTRLFSNDGASLEAFALTCDEDCDDIEDIDQITIWETGDIGFGIAQDGKTSFVSFVPMIRWNRNKTIPSLDDHIERGIPNFPLLYCGDDIGDNKFAIRYEAQVRDDLLLRRLVEIDLSEAT